MNIDIRTLAIIISISNVLQFISLFFYYRINKTYKGVGWWVMGFISMAIGYILLFIRDYFFIKLITIVFANTLILLGPILLYIGILHFLNKKENRVFISSFIITFIVSFLYYTYVDENTNSRTMIVYTAVSIISFLTAYSLLFYKTNSILESSFSLAIIYILQGIFFLTRSILLITIDPINSFFNATTMQSISLLFIFAEGILLTFGLIILVNQRLNSEYREGKDSLEQIFNTNPDAVIITRLVDNTYTNINDGFTKLTGYTREEVVGKSFSEINIWKNPKDREQVLATLREKGVCKNFETVFATKEGHDFFGMLSSEIFLMHGEPHIICVTRDVTTRKKAEEKIKSLLKEKEIILKEVHHRIKNNMNTIHSLLILQSQSLSEPTAITALEEAGIRIHSMAMIYNKLYRSNNYKDVSISDYLDPLVEEIIANFPNRNIVTIEKNIEDFSLNADKMQPIGIIVNELLTNIMKYAFVGRQEGLIRVNVSLERLPTDNFNMVSIIIEDNGTGLPESVDFKNSNGFGLMLVDGLVDQLNGTIQVERENGTKIILSFEK